MELNFQSPGMFIIGGILCAAVCAAAFFLRRKPDRGRALKAANTKRLKMSPLYQHCLPGSPFPYGKTIQKGDGQEYGHTEGYFPVYRPVRVQL